MKFVFIELLQFGEGWRRIADTQNRQSDNGFYVDPNEHLQVYPAVSGPDFFTTGEFHDVTLTNFVSTARARSRPTSTACSSSRLTPVSSTSTTPTTPATCSISSSTTSSRRPSRSSPTPRSPRCRSTTA